LRHPQTNAIFEIAFTEGLSSHLAKTRARGMSDLARSSGLTREGLYKALRSSAQPRFDTIQKVCLALGIKLIAQPIENSSSRMNIGKSGRRAYSVRTARDQDKS
jgi:probable addiction module antidote protein